MQKHICIIGNGIAGITAARNIRKFSDHKITVISSESKYFYARTALMYIYMGHMKYEHTKPFEDWFWEKNRINLIHDKVESIDFDNNTVRLSANKPVTYDQLIIATGSIPKSLNIAGQNLTGVQGFYSLQDLEKIEINTRKIKKAAIVGGGLIGVEMAEMLISRGIQVHFLVRENSFLGNVLSLEESKLLEREIIKHGVSLQLNTEVEQILADSQKKVNRLQTKNGKVLDVDFVGIAVGVIPNIEFLKDSKINTNKGVIVNDILQTNIINVYSIGDCVEHETPPFGRKNIEQIWYSGKTMGETIAKTITGSPTKYEPGIYYNSAKFFDIEYSVYGSISNELVADSSTFYWENREGNKCLRLNYDTISKVVNGIHAFGIRLRQSTCIQWIENKISFDIVIKELEKANFDPEFSKKYFSEIKNQS